MRMKRPHVAARDEVRKDLERWRQRVRLIELVRRLGETFVRVGQPCASSPRVHSIPVPQLTPNPRFTARPPSYSGYLNHGDHYIFENLEARGAGVLART